MNQQATSPSNTNLRRVLIVDDNPRLSRIIELQLRLSGVWMLVGAASYPDEARMLTASEQPDVVLLDLWLHGADTIDLIAELSDSAVPPAVVILTAEPDPIWSERALAAGARAYLSKIDVRDIPAALASILPYRTMPDA
ncbi:MAG: response regulator [Oscillochloris sp.]|nr:response regulator [Oscillochloris sp.]